MENQNINNKETILVHEIGKESRIVVRNGQNVDANDFFFSQYQRAISIVERYCESVNFDKTDSQLENFNNIIAFVGERGSGKTSCMLTFANILTHKDCKDLIDGTSMLNKRSFFQLPAIDPSFFSKNYNIIGAVIASIYNEFSRKAENESMQNGIRQDFYNALAKAQQSFDRLSKGNNDELDELERLEQLRCSLQLKDDLKNLVQEYLKAVGDKDGILLLCIDDIDLNTVTAPEMIEWIRKYLIHSNILILFAIKLDQMNNLVRLRLVEEYKSLLEKDRIPETEIDEMAERYIAKLIPLAHRVYMPDMESIPFVKYKIVSKDSSLGRYTTPKILRNVIVELIFKKTRYLFYNSDYKTNLIVPRNLREALQLIRMLAEMRTINGRSGVVKGTKENCIDDLSVNQKIFKEYLFQDCIVKNLDVNKRQDIEELLNVVDVGRFNATVLQLFSKHFDKVFVQEKSSGNDSNSYPMDVEDDIAMAKPIEGMEKVVHDIMNSKNRVHNISTGDVLWVLDWLDNMERSGDESYFLFIIRTIYSIRMYQYYNQMQKEVEVNYRSDELLANGESKTDISNLNGYQRLLSGHLFNRHLVQFIPESIQNPFVSKGRIHWEEVKKDIKNGTLNLKFVEFLMLCTAGPSESHDTYRRNSYIPYAYSYYRNTHYTVFDIYSFFYNITGIELCYQRFNVLFDSNVVSKILKTGDSLWGEMYSTALVPTIYSDDKKLYLRHHDFKKISELDNSYQKQVCDVSKLGSRECLNEWLSWSSLRNAEIYQDFANYLEINRGKSVSSKLIEKCIGFFESVLSYRRNLYDVELNDSDSGNSYTINFSFVYVVLRMLKELKNRNIDIEKYIKPIESKKQNSGKNSFSRKSKKNNKEKAESNGMYSREDIVQVLFSGSWSRLSTIRDRVEKKSVRISEKDKNDISLILKVAEEKDVKIIQKEEFCKSFFLDKKSEIIGENLEDVDSKDSNNQLGVEL